MQSRNIVVTTGLSGLLLGLLVVVGVLLDRPVLAALGGSGLGLLILLLQVDTWRRVRGIRRFVRDEIRRGAATAPALPTAPAVTAEDVTGAVRVMQAQYTGRMDRMQTSLDEALASLAEHRSASDER